MVYVMAHVFFLFSFIKNSGPPALGFCDNQRRRAKYLSTELEEKIFSALGLALHVEKYYKFYVSVHGGK